MNSGNRSPYNNSGNLLSFRVIIEPKKHILMGGLKVLVDEQDIISTYSEAEQISCAKYTEYKKLIQENPSFGYKRCAKLLNVPQGRTRWWHAKGKKKAVPIPLKTVEKLKNAGLIPFTEKHEHAKTIFNILGTLFGDGGIDIRLNTMAFISSDKRDVDLWHEDLLKIFPFAVGKTQIVEGGEYGHSYNIRCYDRAVVRFFAALGVPIGDKAKIVYSLPKWLFSATSESKKAFLDGFLASEVSVTQWKPYPRNKNFRFQNFSIGLSKTDQLENEHREYLQSVESLLESVGVSTTKNIYKNYSAGTHRKDGFITANYRIFIRTTFQKVLFFNENFPFRYAANKKQRFKAVIQKALKHRDAKQQE